MKISANEKVKKQFAHKVSFANFHLNDMANMQIEVRQIDQSIKKKK